MWNVSKNYFDFIENFPFLNRDANCIKIDTKGVFMCVDNEGVTDYTTGERN
jgi:hypothetical protein